MGKRKKEVTSFSMAAIYKKRLKNMIGALRRCNLSDPMKRLVWAAARVSPANFICAKCQKIHRHANKEKFFECDHIEPFVPLTGIPCMADGHPNWNVLMRRMFPDEKGYQILCATPCHLEKTNQERKIRLKHKKAAKESC